MTKLTEYLRQRRNGIWTANTPVMLAAVELGINPEDVRMEALESLEIRYTPTMDGGVVTFDPLPPRKLTREERKVSKSSQP